MRKSGHLKMTGEPPVGGDEVEEKPKRKSQMPEADETSGDKSCMLFSWANPVRRGAAFVVWHPWFDPVIIVLIVVSSVLLAIDDPRLSLSCPDESNEAQRMYRYTANIKDVDEADQPGRVLFDFKTLRDQHVKSGDVLHHIVHNPTLLQRTGFDTAPGTL